MFIIYINQCAGADPAVMDDPIKEARTASRWLPAQLRVRRRHAFMNYIRFRFDWFCITYFKLSFVLIKTKLCSYYSFCTKDFICIVLSREN